MALVDLPLCSWNGTEEKVGIIKSSCRINLPNIWFTASSVEVQLQVYKVQPEWYIELLQRACDLTAWWNNPKYL